MNLDIDDTSTSNWSPPKGGRVKGNSDGSVVIETGSATVGGVIRNAQGEWLLGFSQKIGNMIVCQAEAGALLQGIQLAWGQGRSQGLTCALAPRI
ncbi:hypothetical protein J1N35_029064 [Gossypium stocksii]|uniref:RNase H type-1 domain-containing protein n=1 Tax=Gossypium stocksii TaxID=47602 RepID=A0A9D3UY69_9ROSI|nr:hypothetical protein J1N35_029064 [Gossypium stocksii]